MRLYSFCFQQSYYIMSCENMGEFEVGPVKRKEWIELFWAVVKYSLIAILAALVIRGFFLIPVPVEGNSMENTLQQNDMIVMEKMTRIKRFDVVVFQLPSGTTYIKRVIGLPGDTIRYENDQLFVNDKKVPETFLSDERREMKDNGNYTSDFDLEELLNQKKLSEDAYFVMGDNRRVSKDSRSFGAITSDEIIGKARFVYYPLRHIRII